jgi:signal transduction histidine kinase
MRVKPKRRGNSDSALLKGAREEELLAALKKAEKEIERLRVIERARKHSQQMLEQLADDLKERVKELNCLYSISSMVERQDISLEEILLETVNTIPDAWQYPEITCGRIALHDQTYQTDNFRETQWRQSKQIVVAGREIGSLDICYLQRKPERDEGPFLKEERSLINVIAERIGEIIERRRAEDALRESEAQNKALVSAIPDMMLWLDEKGVVLGLHVGQFADLPHTFSDIVGNDMHVLCHRKILPRRFVEQSMLYVERTLATEMPHIFEQHLSIEDIGHDLEIRTVVSGKKQVLCMVRDVTQRKRLEREIIEISGREQRRIGQDLHDSLCQHLAGIGFLGKVLEKKIGNGNEALPEDASEIVHLIDQAITLTRSFARGLNPVMLDVDGLMWALEELASNTERLFGITCRFQTERPLLVQDNAVALHLYRIVQEALNNAIKHGKANYIIIAASGDEKAAVVSVKDNGIGLTHSTSHGKGMGLSIMKYRASIIGAALYVRNDEDGGVSMVCTLPTAPQA